MSHAGRGDTRRAFLIGASGSAAAAFVGLPAQAQAEDVPGLKGATYRVVTTPRHRTAYLDVGPPTGPLMIFLHGWPHLGLSWRPQLAHFAAAGWRCVAPDLRGCGGSAAPTRVADYAVSEIVSDMIELHNALGGRPAIWVGHSLGCTAVWAMATHHPERCRGVVNLTVPHFARGNTIANLLPLVDRTIYPADRYPFGQWDYMQFCVEHFGKAVRDFEANAGRVIDMSYTPGSPEAVGKPAPLASIRAQGGWFPAAGAMPPPRTGQTLLSAADRRVMLAAFARNGFSGPCAWYLNDQRNSAYAADAPNFGRIALPVLFLGGQWDTVCDTAHGRLAEPMREDCSDLTEAEIPAGHMLIRERPDDVNGRIAAWLRLRRLYPT